MVALRVRPSWSEGAGGGAESRKSPIPAWKGGLGCRASLGEKRLVVTRLPDFLVVIQMEAREGTGKVLGQGLVTLLVRSLCHA